MERPTRSGRESLSPETRLVLIEHALGAGAKKFTLLEASLQALQDSQKPKPRPVWPFITFGFVLLNAAGAWLWQAAQYPGRDEHERLKAVVEERYERTRQDQIEDRQNILRLQIRSDDAVKEVARVESQLDGLLRIQITRKKP